MRAEDGLFEFEHSRYLVEHYGPVCLACGYSPEEMERFVPGDMLLLGGTIMRRLYPLPSRFEEGDYVGLLKSMTTEQKAALRNAINYMPCRGIKQ